MSGAPAALEVIMSARLAARRHQRVRSLSASLMRYGPTCRMLLLCGGVGSSGGGCGASAGFRAYAALSRAQ